MPKTGPDKPSCFICLYSRNHVCTLHVKRSLVLMGPREGKFYFSSHVLRLCLVV